MSVIKILRHWEHDLEMSVMLVADDRWDGVRNVELGAENEGETAKMAKTVPVL